MNNLYPFKKTQQPVIIIMIVLLSFSANAFSQSFITTWKTDNAGASNSTSITIPTTGAGYNYDVDWNNDGTFDEFGITGSVTHDFGIAGNYTIAIQGNFPRIFFNNGGDKLKIIAIEQWGAISWQSMAGAFWGAANLKCNATDIPDVYVVSDFSNMLNDASSFNIDMSSWTQNMSNVVDMSGMLDHCGLSTANYDLLLNNLQNGFFSNFSIPFSAAGISYCAAGNARQILIDNYGWIITDAGQNCSAPFITTWKTDNDGLGANTDVYIQLSGFVNIDWGDGSPEEIGNYYSNSFAYHDYATPGTYDVTISGNITQMGNGSFTNGKIIDIKQWGDSHWQTFNQAFSGSTNLQCSATDAPDLSGVTDMSLMFTDASSFNGNLNNWDVSHITNMSSMFANATSFNSNISSWDVGNVTDMSNMFSNATSFNSDISNWNVSNVTSIYGMFSNATSFNSDISNWNVGNITIMYGMFSNATSFNSDISNWDVSHVLNMSAMFVNASSFNSDISGWNVSHVEDMSAMFTEASSFNSDISGWDVSTVTSMEGMFEGATSFNSDISNWNVGNVLDMVNMFTDASSFNGDISGWDVSNISDMHNMLTGTALSVSNYDKLLQGWAALPLQSGVVLNADNLQYCSAAAARQSIIDNFGWLIIDAGTNCSLLPVSWLSFTATLQPNGNALLQWKTATETNNAGFTVERSTDNNQWSAIGFVPGHATTQQQSSYSFTDDHVQNGTNYYRIKQTDVDGKISYSKIVLLHPAQSNALRLYPNPGNGELTIDGNISDGKYQVYNAAGKLVLQGSFHSSQLHLSVLRPGMYFIKISDSNDQLKGNNKVIIQ